MIVEGQAPSTQYRQQRRNGRYSYREICDMVSRYQFKSTISSGTYLFTIYNIHELFTEREFRAMMRFNNYGDGANGASYSDLDAELLYSIVKNILSIPANVNEYLNTFSSDQYDAVKLDEPDDTFIKRIKQLIDIAYSDMRNTEIETVNLINEAIEKDHTGSLAEKIRSFAIEWKSAQQKYQNSLNELINELK